MTYIWHALGYILVLSGIILFDFAKGEFFRGITSDRMIGFSGGINLTRIFRPIESSYFLE